MSNLLLITDVARLRKIFGRLTEDKNIRLRVVNNLEKGGEEITIEKPDVVFVQTHLSGLSADILLMHLKKQLGRKRSRFILLASPGQTSDVILKQYQGWLDTSAEDGQLLSELRNLIGALLNKTKKGGESALPEPAATADFKPQPVISAESAVLPGNTSVSAPPQQANNELQLQVAAPAAPELSLEEQGVTYAPRQRLSVYSEFTSSFDNAVSSTPEPETLEKASPTMTHDWDAENIETVDSGTTRSKRGSFLLWLAPVIIAVIVVTYLQQQKPASKPAPAVAKAAPAAPAAPIAPAKVVAPAAPAAQTPPPNSPAPAAPAKAATAPAVAPPAAPQAQDQMSDKAMMTAIAENRGPKSPAAVSSSAPRPTVLPEFIPRYALDKKYGAANPGWERYKGQVTEFKVMREAQGIKAIQVIDRGGEGVPESFMKAALRQVAKKPVLGIDSSEKKEGYEVQRGHIADNIKVVFYRDEKGGKLRAFVLTWQ